MRACLRLLAVPSTPAAPVDATKGLSATRYLTSGNPTGLAGLLTHPSPRATLLYLYTRTLSKLRSLPSHSSYRASTEALTSHRLSIISGVKPAGWDEWNTRSQELLKKHPALFKDSRKSGRYLRAEVDGKSFVWERLVPQLDPLEDVEWRGERPTTEIEGSGDEEEKNLGELVEPREEEFGEGQEGEREWLRHAEPKLEAGQIAEVEEKIGAGLIEEVIEVAEGELQLVDTMVENKVWEELTEKAPAGQWDYFSRDRYVSGTQEPPK